MLEQMSSLLCLVLLVSAAPADDPGPGVEADEAAGANEEIEEEVDFEEDVDFGDEEPVARVELPDIEYRAWLLALPVLLLGLLAWNVIWRRPPKKPPRS